MTRHLRWCAATVLCLGLTACSAQVPNPSTRPSASATSAQQVPTSGSPPASFGDDACLAKARSLDVEQQLGQLFMVGVSTSALDGATREVMERFGIGSAVLLGNSPAGASEISAVTAELAGLETVTTLPILVAVDQEGGAVQRLKGEGFSDIPPALEQGRYQEGELRTAAERWGRELAAVGVHYDLAPVADVVPADKQDSNAPIGKLERNFGHDPKGVSASTVEFVEGMQAAGVATSLKHFPGLGEVSVNTDFGVAEDVDITAEHESLAPFRAGIAAGADSVMVSSAVFTLIDPKQEAVFSRAVITDLLRTALGFDDVVISDDLGAAEAVSDVAPAQRATRFFAAGGDLLINADAATMPEMFEASLAWAGEDEAHAARVAESAGRVLSLKQSAGLLSCS